MKKIFTSITLCIILLFGCSSEKDPVTGKPKTYEVNPQVKARQYVEKGGGILGDFNKSRGNTTYNFATSNIMWRATLSSLDFMPLQAIDYAGGIIVTDWYSPSSNLRESVKINIRFLSDQVSANSFKVTSYKKICDDSYLKCTVSKSNESFDDEIKNKIMKEVIALNIKETQNKKK